YRDCAEGPGAAAEHVARGTTSPEICVAHRIVTWTCCMTFRTRGCLVPWTDPAQNVTSCLCG
ncbi:MAG: hypothetical protein RRA35_08710, partial [Desulfomonilia bacterium]|nr:hypothetical protein [Desulfomonilia bacterium]